MWSTFKIPVLTVSVSGAGLLSLTLSGLLPWPVFLALACFHVWAALNFSRALPLSTQQVLLVTALFFLAEMARVLAMGTGEIPYCLRDIIVYFAVLRLLLPKTGREIYQIVAIGLAQCMLSTIFTSSPMFLIGLAFMGLLIPMALSALDEQDFGPTAGRTQGFLHWASVYAGIVTTACILFFIIPRPSSTLVSYALNVHEKKGFSEETKLDRTEAVADDRQILMRIYWNEGDAPGLFYLAGSRLDALAAQGFTRTVNDETANLDFEEGTDRLTIYQTELDSLNVFHPFKVTGVSPPRAAFKGLNLYWNRTNPPVYQVWVDRWGDRTYRPSLHVPDELLGAASLGRTIAGVGTAEEKARRIVRHLEKNCTYTLDGLRIPPGVSPILWFLQDGKRGSCEHFASALAVMLRGCGIPSRVVTGFIVHEFNQAGGYFIIRASDAHAWVEYFSMGAWKTCEATPQSLGASGRVSSFIDAIRFAWIRWVIRYSLNDQIHIATTLSSATREFELKVGLALGITCAVASLALVFWVLSLFLKRRRTGSYGIVVRAFAKKGLRLEKGLSHEEHLEQVSREWPAMSGAFRSYLESYLPKRFGSGKDDIPSATARLVEAIKRTGR